MADAPVEVLLEGAEVLAKFWLLGLIERRPLGRAPSLLTGELAGEGPAICAAMVRALADDAELERIAKGGELEPAVARVGELAGASTPEEVSQSVDELRAVIWSASLSALEDPDTGQVAELAERLALIGELVRGAALRRSSGARSGWAQPSLWPAVLEREIDRSRRAGVVMSLLLVELEDVGRILAVEPPERADEVLEGATAAIRSAVRRGDTVVGDGAMRAWVIAPGTDRDGAAELGADLVQAVRGAGSWRGARLSVAIGVATLGEDAGDVQGLIEAAEEARFTASARGIDVFRTGPPGAPG